MTSSTLVQAHDENEYEYSSYIFEQNTGFFWTCRCFAINKPLLTKCDKIATAYFISLLYNTYKKIAY